MMKRGCWEISFKTTSNDFSNSIHEDDFTDISKSIFLTFDAEKHYIEIYGGEFRAERWKYHLQRVVRQVCLRLTLTRVRNFALKITRKISADSWLKNNRDMSACCYILTVRKWAQ
jgi:hypothetical protein